MTATISTTHDLTRALGGSSSGCLIVTGAGISSASGIQTFRGPEPGAIWKASDVEMATRRLLTADPVRHWLWYLDRFAAVDGATPNAAHRAVGQLEIWAGEQELPFQLVTQNIDLLHERAGSRRLIKVHGTAGRVRCSADGCPLAEPAGSIDRAEIDLEPFWLNPSSITLPACPECGSVLRPHVLFFDEYYDSHRDYQIDEVLAAASSADVVVFVGTSFSVGITDMLLRAGWQSGAKMFSIDPHSAPPPGHPLQHLAENAEASLPELIEQLENQENA